MTNDEGKEFLDILMDATGRVVDSRTNQLVHMEPATVRLVSEGTPGAYVRPIADISTPTTATPTSVSQLDDGDIWLPNYSGCYLVQGDKVDVQYSGSIEFGFIARKYGEPMGAAVTYRGRADQISSNFNDFTRPGLYHIGSQTMTNGPAAYTWCYLIVTKDNYTGGAFQQVIRADSTIYTRALTGSPLAWTSWMSNKQNAYGDLSVTGNYYYSGNDPVYALPTATWKTITSRDLAAGKWVVTANARFSSNATGVRKMVVTKTADSSSSDIGIICNDCRNATDGDFTYCSTSFVLNLSTASTIYLNAYQNSGSSINTFGRMYIIRII